MDATPVDTSTKSELPKEIPSLVSLLESRERIVEVCQAIRELIDPFDDHYVTQKNLATEGIISILVDLLSTVKDNTEELLETCETLRALCANIDGVSTRKRSGLESGFQERSFNPVQDELIEYNAFRKLVDLLDIHVEGVPETVLHTLLTCCSFNQANKVVYLRCLVHDLLEYKNQRLEQINMLVTDMEMKDDVTVLLDQVILPVLRLVQDQDSDVKREALFLMGKICERHPASSSFLCEEGAIPPVVEILLNDDLLCGKAVHVLWQLIRLDKKQLDPSRGKLPSGGAPLVKPLLSIIKSSPATTTTTDIQGETDQEDAEEDYSDEALLVLKALAQQDESVREQVGDLIEPETSRCSIV